MGKRRTKEEIAATLRAGEEALKNGISGKQFCLTNGINLQKYYSDRYRSTHQGVARRYKVTATNGDLAGAIAILQSHGFRLPKRITEASRADIPKLKPRDIRALKRWCKWSFVKQQRFTVGWSNTVKHAHIICHSLPGLKYRQQHIHKIRVSG